MGTPVGSKTTLGGAAAAAAVVTIVVVVFLRLRDGNWSLDGTSIPLWVVWKAESPRVARVLTRRDMRFDDAGLMKLVY
jgi:hypothetical protein